MPFNLEKVRSHQEARTRGCRVCHLTSTHKHSKNCALTGRLTLNYLGTRTRRSEGRLDHDTGQFCFADAVPPPRAPSAILAVKTVQPHFVDHDYPFGPLARTSDRLFPRAAGGGVVRGRTRRPVPLGLKQALSHPSWATAPLSTTISVRGSGHSE